MNGYADEPAIEPARLTASTGRSARSTSPPQIRRNRRENEFMSEWSAREEPERRLDRRADQRREHDSTHPDRSAKHEAGDKNGDFDQGADGSDAQPQPARADEHQRVARPGAHRGPDVERRADSEREQPRAQQTEPGRA